MEVCTQQKYECLCGHISNMKVKQKRKIFSILRKTDVDVNSFLPEFGLFASEFAVFQLVTEKGRGSSERGATGATRDDA